MKLFFQLIAGENSRDVVANVLNSDIQVSEFEMKSNSYVHSWTNTPESGKNPVIHLTLG